MASKIPWYPAEYETITTVVKKWNAVHTHQAMDQQIKCKIYG